MTGNRNGSLKWQRYEAKYVISETQAAEVRRWCLDHLPPDPHSSRLAGFEYPVVSTYLDSPSRELLRHTLGKQANRYKLRMRTYRRPEAPTTGLPGFFEVKRKINGIVQKTRARLSDKAGEELLWSNDGLLGKKWNCDLTTETNMNEFLQLRRRIGAQPVLGVFYRREAYEGHSAERIRMTLDRDVHCGILAPPTSGQRDMWWPTGSRGVILEIKFTNSYPFWVADMLRRVEVIRRGVCKYVMCFQAADRRARQGSGMRRLST